MSTINNIPFDINRLPTETNKVPKRKDAAPVYSSEAMHGAEKQLKSNDRRKRKDRRKHNLSVSKDRRRLMQRRQTRQPDAESVALVSSGRGRIIDLEV